MAAVDGVQQDDEGYDAVPVSKANPAAAAISMSKGSDSSCGNSDCTEADDKNLSQECVEHVCCMTEAACSNITAGDRGTCCQVADVVDIIGPDDVKSLHHCNEYSQDENSKSFEYTDSSSSKFEDTFELSHVHETQSDAATSEDDDWMYVLGHDQLKKRACIICYRFYRTMHIVLAQ